MKYAYGAILCIIVVMSMLSSCKKEVKKPHVNGVLANPKVLYATGFAIEKVSGYTVIKVSDPWPGATKIYTYAFIPKDKLPLITYPKDAYDAIVPTPIHDFVSTSTTHIPAIEALDGLDKLIGFPNTEYISSMTARKLIKEKKIKELGKNENLNTEMVLEMTPSAVVGFGIDNANSTYEILEKANIPVIFNGDWNEKTPLGKAEWIKFFGVLLNKEKEADSIFNQIATEYQKAKNLTKNIKQKPTILSGALYKDVWYMPAGQSWASQFLEDAGVDYLWKSSKGSGSLSLSLESVLEKGSQADFWISPSQFTSYKEMEVSNSHYLEFNAFKAKKIYSFANTKGPTGGLLYYELAPQRPDLVLKDLVHIFHPELLPDHNPYFFTPLH